MSDTILIPLLQGNSVQAGSPDFPRDFIYPECVTRNAILFISITPLPIADSIGSMQSYEPENNQSFTPFREIADYCSTSFGFLELQSIRESKQHRMARLMQSDIGKQCIGNQQAVASRLIREAIPEVIVVLNASPLPDAKNFWFGSKLSLEPQSGAFHWNGIPIFFSRPFLGTDALENHAFHQLKEQIRNVLLLKAEQELTQTLSKRKSYLERCNDHASNEMTATSEDIFTGIVEMQRYLETRVKKLVKCVLLGV